MPDDLVTRLRNYYTEDDTRYCITHSICDEAADRIEALTEDAERFAWWFSPEPKQADFVLKYLEGVREKWSMDQWRALIDAARRKQ